MSYAILESELLNKQVELCMATEKEISRVTYGSPAIHVMTDLKKKTAIRIDSKASLHEARLKMLDKNIHLLFVDDEDFSIVGIITSEDISGEKPIKLGEKWRVKFREIQVTDIMTSAKNLEVLKMEDINKAKVGNLVATLKSVNRVHALVIEEGSENADFMLIRGIFSLNQIGRQLGTELHADYYENIGNILQVHQREFNL
jgi:CBS-domain-containing membrane protein